VTVLYGKGVSTGCMRTTRARVDKGETGSRGDRSGTGDVMGLIGLVPAFLTRRAKGVGRTLKDWVEREGKKQRLPDVLTGDVLLRARNCERELPRKRKKLSQKSRGKTEMKKSGAALQRGAPSKFLRLLLFTRRKLGKKSS